ncbi:MULTISPECIES: cache domain-containing protein [unclassified Ectothiorhodospira]|uniref:cache domain-containing protein n=1 Tax=unclassified Ectothiorhodospira TaxID=2684909 RepID=UPI001EE90863|nr:MULTISPECIES: cache domain-containing protein [unclassified Ectothiorhodospira]MCG5516211.1 cache domain-containing protein [Ectothiorhodospira sp. 9100]MCG5519636.1 cache domain-containing protein [Ectothiorhodospira sp. 9905]
MKKILIGIAAAALMAPAFADEMATPDEAKAMSEKAQSAVNEMGSEAAFAAFADPEGDFQEKDLYVFCMDMDGVMLSHAVKPELAGKNLLDFNEYGDLLFQDMVTLAQESGEGWVDYNWPYPGTDEIKQKTSYIATNDEGFFCGVGAYK